MESSNRTGELKYLLLIDADPSNRATLCEILHEDYCIFQTENSAEALRVVQDGADIAAIIYNPLSSDVPDYSVIAELTGDSHTHDIPIIIVARCGDDQAQIDALSAGAADLITKPYNSLLVRRRISNLVVHHDVARTTVHAQQMEQELLQADTDDVSGLHNKYSFLRRTAQILQKNPTKRYILMRWDIDNYKIYNDTFGTEVGDDYLRQVGQYYLTHQDKLPGVELVGRYEADHFVCLREADCFDPDKSTASILRELHKLNVRPFDFVPRIGLYRIDDPELNVSLMCDRALLALKSVKYSYNISYAWYSDAMRKELILEQSIVSGMESALKNEEFKVYLQPQYNHGTGELTGAEALVRWRRSDGSVTPPDVFISTFEKNGFIYELDKYMWEHVCSLLRRWLDKGLSPAPISVNVSRHDVMHDSFLPTLIGYVEAYHLPVRLLRLEITESAFSKDTDRLVSIVTKLRDYGFTVEIDDFGSGYSSFNTLKDVPADVLKLDMRFLQGKDNLQRGGNILESIVRMTSWLGMQVIAEGVETTQQADFLHSIGCSHIQGYLYAKPMPVEDFEHLMADSKTASVTATIASIKGMDTDAFWNPESLDSLIFSSYVGGACVMEYSDDKLVMVRINDSFRDELHMKKPLTALMGFDLFSSQPTETVAQLKVQLAECTNIGATASGVSPVRITHDVEPHTEYLRYTLHVIAKTGNRLLLYALVENVTKQTLLEKRDREKTNQLRLLNDISGDLLSEPDADKAISNVLHKLIGYLSCSRAYVAELDTQKQVITTTYEAVPDGNSSRKVSPIRPTHATTYWMDAFMHNSHVFVDAKGSISAAEQEILQLMNATTLIAVPIKRDGGLIGMLAVADPKVNTDHVEHLVTLGDYMAVILTRRDLNAKIQLDNTTLLNMMNDMPGGFARMRIYPDGHIAPVFLNSAFCLSFGMSQEEAMALYGANAFAGVHPDDLASVNKQINALITDGDATALTVRLMRKDGSAMAMRAFYRITKDEHGDHYLNGYYVNMDSEFEAEQRRRELLDNLPVAMIAYVTDSKTQPMYINCNAYRLFGFEPANDPGDETGGLSAAFIPDEVADPRALIELLGSHERIELPPIQSKRKDGSGFWLSCVIHRVKHEDGSPMICVLLSDVTDKVTTAQELKTRKAELITINDSIPGGICRYTYDTDGRFNFVSDALLQMLGYSQAEFSKEFHNRFSEMIYWEDREQTLAAINSSLSGSDTSNGNIYRVQTKSGALKWLLSTSRLIEPEPGQQQVVCIMLDIDHQRRLEDSLRLEQNKIANLLSTTPGGIACYRYENWAVSLEYVNDGLCTLLGFSHDEIFGSDTLNRRSLLHPDDVQQLTALRNISLQTGCPLRAQYRHLTKSGNYLWIYLDARFVLEEPGTGMMYAFYMDITELKAQQSSEPSQLPSTNALLGHTLSGATAFTNAELQNILNLIPGGFSTFVVQDGQVKRTFISDGALKALGYTNAEVVPDDAVNTLVRVHPDNRAAVRAKIAEAVEKVRVLNVDMHIVPTSGKEHWVNLLANPVVMKDGKLHYFGIYTDVTERRAAEDRRLARYHRELQYLAAVSSEGLLGKMRINLTTGEIEHLWLDESFLSSCTGQDYAMFCKEVCRSVITAQQRDELSAMMDAQRLLKEHAKGNTEFRLEYQRRNLNGRIIWVATTIKTYTGSISGYVKAFIYTYDIDEKKTLSMLVDRVLTQNTDLLGLVDISTGNLHLYHYRNIHKHSNIPSDVDYTLGFESYIRHCVAETDQIEAMEAFRLENILSHLTDANATHVLSFWTDTDGERYRKQWIYSWLDDSMTTVVICRMDVTAVFRQQEAHRAALKLVQVESERARLDSATGILNHSATEEEISNRLFSTADGHCALLLLDLDDLKTINDLYGHPAGDVALISIAQTLKRFFRNGDVVGRIGGDEFMVFLDNVTDAEAFRPSLHRLLNELQKIRVGQHNEHVVHCSVGCVIADYRTASFAALYKQADVALYHVKRNGKNGFAFYTPQMETAAYDYEGQKAKAPKKSELLNLKELQMLLNAVSMLYPMIIYVNLTQNSYDMLAYDDFETQLCKEGGCFDDLIDQGVTTFMEEDQASFFETFSRQNLLRAYMAGARHVWHRGRQRGDDGIYRMVQTDVIFLPSIIDSDVYQVTLSRAVQPDENICLQ